MAKPIFKIKAAFVRALDQYKKENTHLTWSKDPKKGIGVERNTFSGWERAIKTSGSANAELDSITGILQRLNWNGSERQLDMPPETLDALEKYFGDPNNNAKRAELSPWLLALPEYDPDGELLEVQSQVQVSEKEQEQNPEPVESKASKPRLSRKSYGISVIATAGVGVLTLTVLLILQFKDENQNPAIQTYNLTGQWDIEAQDVEVSDHDLDYGEYEPQTLKLEIKVTQDGNKLRASGVDEDGDELLVLNGELLDDYISGSHVLRPGYPFHGVFFLKIKDPDKLEGYYLQRPTRHESNIVFGTLKLTRVGDRSMKSN